MTLIISIRGTNGVVLASDSRGTFGDPRGPTAQNDTMKKLYVLTDKTAMLVSGIGEVGANIHKELSQELVKKKVKGCTKVMNLTRKMVMEKYQEWFGAFPIIHHADSPTPPQPALEMIVGGSDFEDDKEVQRIYSLRHAQNFSPFLHDYGFGICGVGQIAVYLMNRLYDPSMSLDDVSALAAHIIAETAAQDGKVGGPIQMVVIQEGKEAKELSKEEIHAIVAENEEKTRQLRRLFKTGE